MTDSPRNVGLKRNGFNEETRHGVSKELVTVSNSDFTSHHVTPLIIFLRCNQHACVSCLTITVH